MMKFEEPRLEVLAFLVEDIVTLSGGLTDGGEGDGGSGNFGDLFG